MQGRDQAGDLRDDPATVNGRRDAPHAGGFGKYEDCRGTAFETHTGANNAIDAEEGRIVGFLRRDRSIKATFTTRDRHSTTAKRCGKDE
jgi:hypothetical protein